VPATLRACCEMGEIGVDEHDLETSEVLGRTAIGFSGFSRGARREERDGDEKEDH